MFTDYPRILADHHMIEFITDCLRLIVGGNLDPHELESLLEYELETHHQEAQQPAHAVQRVADALPGFGIVAAVLGIVDTMASIDGADTGTIGRKVGAALVGTFLGILVAYGFVGPIAAAIEHRVHEEGKAFEVVKMALVASVRGYAPPVAVEFARKLLWSDVRPTFADLENHLKGKKKEPQRRRAGMSAPEGRAADPDRQAVKKAACPSWRRLEGRLCRLRDRDDGVLHGDVADRLGVEGAARGDL
jgi:chemotaxis protein MotA